ncbi:hypothetical protein DRB17_07425 [Ferruginivarius sediminum]|uniref:Protein translocase subunit SecA n=2 Tax=Ferruginivarius sediminum TaxID=2661937 RepID=A0A369TCP5_9PROT|nr:hypothetical protein DRB17_07425 [Ferruginivarius sediminum]
MLEAACHAVYARTAARWRMAGRARAKRSARRAGAMAAEITALSDTDLRARATALHRSVAQAGAVSEALRPEGLAVIAEAAWRQLGLRPHPVQLAGAAVLLDGAFAEMETGEGKTLTAALAAALLALTGEPVHVLTANDYLATRDAGFVEPLLRFLGLSVGAVAGGMPEPERRAAYRASVTYGSGKEVAFDYLRDRLVLGTAGHARLRVSGLRGDDRRRERLVMRGLGACIVDEADSIMVDEARTPLVLSRDIEGELPAEVCHEALRIADTLSEGGDFAIDRTRHRVELTEAGEDRVAELSADLEGLWRVAPHRRDLAVKALSARHLFRRDEHYLVADSGVEIIDEYTGRTMPDRFWNDGLHQMIEAKEGCEVSGIRTPLLRLTYQRFFRRYRHLSGMSGTLVEVAAELWSVYRARVFDLPTHRPLRRQRLRSRLFPDETAKWSWIAGRTAEMIAKRRPVLIGVRTVDAARRAHDAIRARGIDARLLSAAQDKEEAEIVSEAGAPGAVTVATNMAGRGTDIKLAPGVAEAGGLHVIVAERHQSRRIDRQLAGRCARQGDPGSFEICVSAEDELAPRLVRHAPFSRSSLGRPIGLWLVDRAQARLERIHGRARARLVRQDQNLEGLLAFAGEDL